MKLQVAASSSPMGRCQHTRPAEYPRQRRDSAQLKDESAQSDKVEDTPAANVEAHTEKCEIRLEDGSEVLAPRCADIIVSLIAAVGVAVTQPPGIARARGRCISRGFDVVAYDSRAHGGSTGAARHGADCAHRHVVGRSGGTSARGRQTRRRRRDVLRSSDSRDRTGAVCLHAIHYRASVPAYDD